jgi:hypothetical protein
MDEYKANPWAVSLLRTKPTQRLAVRKYESVLFSILHLIGCIPWPSPSVRKRKGRPYVYSPTVILRCFIVRIWFRIDSNNALHEFLLIDSPYNRKLMAALGLETIPDRRTFDRRLKKTMPSDIKQRIAAMGRLIVAEAMDDPIIVAPDSTLLRAKGAVWHKSSMEKDEVPHSGIDTDARWGFSHTRGWIFGYKLHITSSTGSLIVPLSADFTTANVQDNQLYVPMASNLPPGVVQFAAADPAYDDRNLYEYSTNKLGIDIVCPITRYEHTPADRLELMHFYESEIGQAIYRWRSISVEPLIERIKSVFRIDPLPVRGYHRAAAVVLMSVLLYQLLVYYNCKTGVDNPTSIKYMIGSY